MQRSRDYYIPIFIGKNMFFFCKCYCIAYLENKIIVYTLKRRKRNAYEVAPPKVARALKSSKRGDTKNRKSSKREARRYKSN